MNNLEQQVNLSYIITTRNRLPFLKITLQNLLDQLQADEEVVVVDSVSTDGTQTYLEGLYKEGKINQYLSEPDRNQAEGWNKAMSMAKGQIIKKIIDDDVFCYEAIRKCKAYMLQNPQVDVVISNDLSSRLNDHKNIGINSRLPQFESWRGGAVKSFTFSDVNMLIRQSALSNIGLYDTNFTMMDWEYALRISYKQINIAYYTGYNALTVGHPQTVTSNVNYAQLQKEGKLGAKLYEYAGDQSEISTWSKIKIFIGKLIYKQRLTAQLNQPVDGDVADIYAHYYKYLHELNQQGNFSFISAR